MLIHEFQAKKILKELGLLVPDGQVAETIEEAKNIAQELGFPVVLKAQILAGGRGKAGGIKTAKSAEEVGLQAASLLNARLVTLQTGPQGKLVKKILVEKYQEIKREFYFGLSVDRKNERLVALVSRQGGVEIEEQSRSQPELIKQEIFFPETGLYSFQRRNLAYFLDLPAEVIRIFMDYMEKLGSFFLSHDLKLLEINPLFLTETDQLVAGDIKMDFDDSGLAKHPELSPLEDLSELSLEEIRARKFKLNYLKMRGRIGCLVNGAGLAMATMDIIQYFGGQPANFLDIGGGVTEEAVSQAFEILLSDREVTSALVNIFGGIVRCDLVARGMVASARRISLQKPVVVRLEGTNVDEGKKILEESGLPFYFLSDFEAAARKAVELSQVKLKE
ncbi:MAG: ADP-forming succinate--CoA ligase subunit beta [Candidatus Aminicenantes bacterium]|nr:ADP-forming succinate--CoA ligase subunit beta [Candidatus Aminicenantes bacterium]